MIRKRDRSGLAHDLMMLVIAVCNLIAAIFHYMSGASNYGLNARHLPA